MGEYVWSEQTEPLQFATPPGCAHSPGAEDRHGDPSGQADDVKDFLDGESRRNIRGMRPRSVEPPSENDRLGLPRPMVEPEGFGGIVTERAGRKLPTPWINGAKGMDGDFFSFRDDHVRALDERRCCICGDQLNRTVAIAAAHGRNETSAGWGHPRCVHLAVSLCPHFQSEAAHGWETVAWLYEGPGVGVSDPSFEDMDKVDQPAEPIGRMALKALSQTNPWGL